MKLHFPLLTLLILCSTSLMAKENPTPANSREDLNHGYTFLYKNLKDLRHMDELMMIKKEAQQVHDIANDIADTSEKITKKLEDLEHDYPALKLEHTGQPNVIEEKKKALKKDKIKKFMPITGKSGEDFERTFLINTSAVMDDSRITAHLLADMETDKNLKKNMEEFGVEFTRIVNRIEKLLNEKYYKHNLYQPISN